MVVDKERKVERMVTQGLRRNEEYEKRNRILQNKNVKRFGFEKRKKMKGVGMRKKRKNVGPSLFVG